MAPNFNWQQFIQNLANNHNQKKEWSQKQESSTPSVVAFDNGISNNSSQVYQQQVNQLNSGMNDFADAMSSMPGQYGAGFTYGYQGAKVLMSGWVSYKTAKYNKKILGAQAELSDLQAKAYQTAAEDVLRSGNQQVAAITFQAGQAKSAARVSQASAGIRIQGAGSAAETLASIQVVTDMQVNQTLANAVAESFGYQRKKTQQKMNSIAVRSAQSGINPWASAIVSTLSAAAKAAPSVASAYMGSASGSGAASSGSKSFKPAPGN